MTQRAPYPQDLVDLVSMLKYRPGWRFNLSHQDRGQGSEGLTLDIIILAPDTYHPEQNIRVRHLMIVPSASYDRRSWRRWLFEQILLVERHEACEFFQIDGSRPYAPNHGPGNDPYIVFEEGTLQEKRTSYLGEQREKDDPDDD
jgi:hypothetical protein